jgi:hypothetical protein
MPGRNETKYFPSASNVPVNISNIHNARQGRTSTFVLIRRFIQSKKQKGQELIPASSFLVSIQMFISIITIF